MEFRELNNDQRRELVNTEQRFRAFREAEQAARQNRGSVTWSNSKGRDYLVRSSYNHAGLRKQTSLGVRSPGTEDLKRTLEARREVADKNYKNLREVLLRQSAINRALGLGRVPTVGARVIRAIDRAGLLGSGLTVLGTHALFAYEAAAGVHLDASLAATEDIDLLFDARRGLSVAAAKDFSDVSLIRILKKADASFERSNESYRAANRDGYLVDLIQPTPRPPWKAIVDQVGSDPDDLTAVQIEGLEWLQNAPPFEAISVDDKGKPLRIVAADPRVWAAHKLWLSKRPDRQALKRRRDADQARAVAKLVTDFLPHLAFDSSELKMLPFDVFEAAAPLFKTT